MEVKLILTELWLLNLVIWQLFYNIVYHLLQQFSMNRIQTLHTFCQDNKDVRVRF